MGLAPMSSQRCGGVAEDAAAASSSRRSCRRSGRCLTSVSLSEGAPCATPGHSHRCEGGRDRHRLIQHTRGLRTSRLRPRARLRGGELPLSLEPVVDVAAAGSGLEDEGHVAIIASLTGFALACGSPACARSRLDVLLLLPLSGVPAMVALLLETKTPPSRARGCQCLRRPFPARRKQDTRSGRTHPAPSASAARSCRRPVGAAGTRSFGRACPGSSIRARSARSPSRRSRRSAARPSSAAAASTWPRRFRRSRRSRGRRHGRPSASASCSAPIAIRSLEQMTPVGR